MKKTLIVAAGLYCLATLGAADASHFSGDIDFGFETEHFNRGRPELKKTVTPSAELRYGAFGEGNVYIGCKSALALRSNINDRTEVKPYVGLSYNVTDKIMLDVGYIRHFYTNIRKLETEIDYFLPQDQADTVSSRNTAEVASALEDSAEAQDADSVGDLSNDGQGDVAQTPDRMMPQSEKAVCARALPERTQYKHSNEAYVGLMADVLMKPSIYFFYDFEKEEIDIEGKVSYSYDLSDCLIPGFSLDFKGKVGYDKAEKPYVIKNAPKTHGYVYYGAGLGLSYALADNAKLSAWVNYEGNCASKGHWANAYVTGARKSGLFFSTSVSCSF